MAELAFVNGSFCPIAEACVAVEDRGFQFADGVYEVVVFRGRRPVLLEQHLQRLQNSCAEIDLPYDVNASGLEDALREGVRRAGLPETMVYVQITRGVAPRNHVVTADLQPTVVMTFRLKPAVSAAQRTTGIAVCTVPDDRWARCHIKSIALLANVLAKNAAVRAGYDDALFVGPDEDVREAAAANIFVIREGHLLTPPRNRAILPGITRNWILDCARRIDIPIREQTIQLADLLAAEEVFVSSTTIDLLSVVRVDAHTIGDGRPGPLASRIHAAMLADLDDDTSGV